MFKFYQKNITVFLFWMWFKQNDKYKLKLLYKKKVKSLKKLSEMFEQKYIFY